MTRLTLLAAVLAAVMLAKPSHANETAVDLANLQVIMQRHIDSQLIDGAMHKIDFEDGTITEYYPTEAHPMVMAFGDDYILCTDLASKGGDAVPVDFYLTEADGTYRVYQTEIDNRQPLRGLMDKGLVKRVR